MNKRIFFLAALSLFLLKTPSLAQNTKIKSEIEKVKVFTNSAQVFRTAQTKLTAGKHTLIIDNLPKGIDKSSIQAKVSLAELLNVRLVKNFLDLPEKDEKLVELDKNIKVLRHKTQEQQAVLQILQYEERMLTSNRNLAGKVEEIDELLMTIKRTRRRANPADLLFLLNKQSDSINQSLALALGMYRHKNTRAILLNLLTSNDDYTKEFATDSLLKLYGQEIEMTLVEMNDKLINKTIDEWKE